MNRYEYVRQHINAFQHEYKMMMMGKMTAEQLPSESVQGILYYMLQQLIDCYDSALMFDNHLGFIDEMVEDYNFDAYLGIMSIADEKTYGMDNMLRAASPLLQIMQILEDGNNMMNKHIDNITDSVKSLFARLFEERKEAVHFFGGEIFLDKAREMWIQDKFMQTLVSNIILYDETDDEEDRIQMVIDELFIEPCKVSNFPTQAGDDEDLPFN